MRNLSLILMFFVNLTISCSTPSDKVKIDKPKSDSLTAKVDSTARADSMFLKELIKDYDLNIIDTFAVGDVNGDGEKDKAIIQPPVIFFHGQIDSEYVKIKFTCDIPPIKHYVGFRGLIANAGDLDGNNTDEIIYVPDWFQGMWTSIYVYGYKNNKWILFGRGDFNRMNIVDSKNPIKFIKSRVKKINNKSFLLIQSVMKEVQIVNDSATIIEIN